MVANIKSRIRRICFGQELQISFVLKVKGAETYSQIKDEIADLFKTELAALDKEDEPATKETGLEINIPKPGKKQFNKKQRRQMNKRNRQRERGNMRKLKQGEDNQTSELNTKFISTAKNDDVNQVMSM
jgi:hypothetical protein